MKGQDVPNYANGAGLCRLYGNDKRAIGGRNVTNATDMLVTSSHIKG